MMTVAFDTSTITNRPTAPKLAAALTLELSVLLTLESASTQWMITSRPSTATAMAAYFQLE